MVILIGMTILFITGLWLTDLGSSALGMQAAGFELQVKSLLAVYTPNTIYHIGLVTCGLMWYVMMAWIIFEVINK